MLFNSVDFAFFLPLVFFTYWGLSKFLRAQNVLILISSYFFYACWDYRFLLLIIGSTLIDYFIGKKIGLSNKPAFRKRFFYISIFLNIGVLCYFKYFDFFIENFAILISQFGLRPNLTSLNVILPIGISFYTFQTLSYTIDVYRGKIKHCSNLLNFAAFITFFPQLVAGPIERASDLLPQFYTNKKFHYNQAVDGLRQILWGLFKKAVIADNCAQIVDQLFNNSDLFSGSTLLLAALLFAFQIYCDFSGYTDIAIGTAKLFGFNLRRNFDNPFFSKNISVFWNKWHISLSSWLRDYVFTPLTIYTRDWGKAGLYFSTLLSFSLIGLWHGANWTFVIFGILHGSAIILEIRFRKQRKKWPLLIGQNFYLWSSVILTFFFFSATLIFFRSDDVDHALSIFKEIFSKSLFSIPLFKDRTNLLYVGSFILILLLMEYRNRKWQHTLEGLYMCRNKAVRLGIYYLLIYAIIWFGGRQVSFIYFQF